MKKSVAEVVAEMIAKMLDNGVSPWHQPWANGMPRSVNGNYYRGWNAILLGFQNYNDPRYLTFNKVKELGGNVKKGEKGHYVYFWQFTKKEILNENGEKEIKQYAFAKSYYVFNVEQCDGLNLKPCKGFNQDNNPIKQAEAIWNNYQDKPELLHNAKSAFYCPSKDYISIPEMKQFENSEAYYSTLFHEAVHSTGVKHRLDRLTNDSFGSEKYGKEELVAEIGSQLLCQSIGITRTLDNAVAYCKSWSKAIKEMPANAVLNAASQAQKAVDYILGVKYDD